MLHLHWCRTCTVEYVILFIYDFFSMTRLNSQAGRPKLQARVKFGLFGSRVARISVCLAPHVAWCKMIAVPVAPLQHCIALQNVLLQRPQQQPCGNNNHLRVASGSAQRSLARLHSMCVRVCVDCAPCFAACWNSATFYYG